MKKLSVDSVEEEIKHGLISCKYEYPTTCTTYDREGNITSRRVVTHNITATEALIKLRPALARTMNTYEDDDVLKDQETVQQMFNSLGK